MSVEERGGIFGDVYDLIDRDASRGYPSQVIHYSVR